MVITGGARLLRAKGGLTRVEANACCPDNDPKTGGTLMIAVPGRLAVPLVPVLSLFCRQNQMPAARAKANKIQGNRLLCLRVARYLVSSRMSGYSHRT
jgi:hypothetical protein